MYHCVQQVDYMCAVKYDIKWLQILKKRKEIYYLEALKSMFNFISNIL